MECKNQPNKMMKCGKKNGEYYWTVDSDGSGSDENCPEHSLPWRIDALCSVQDGKKCYQTKLGDDTVAVCVEATDSSALNTCGQEYLKKKHVIANDHEIEDLSTLNNMMECSLQTFGQMMSTNLRTYVPKGREDLCEQIVEEAIHVCDGKPDCDYKVEKLMTDEPSSSYECVINTRDVPTLSSRPKWWEWHRVNEYECKKDKGWLCDDSSLQNYKGGEKCFMKDDCNSNAEFGMCVNKKCVLGSAPGSNCTTHEDCDILQNVEGVCENNATCKKGKNGLNVSYYKPKDCSDDDKHYSHSLHNYCGEIVAEDGTKKYTGYCAPVNGSMKKACKAFSHDVQDIRNEEENYLRGIRHHQNYYKEPPPWENLVKCPESERVDVNGHTLCFPTVEKINVNLGKVHAQNSYSAEQKCHEKFNVPQVALPSF